VLQCVAVCRRELQCIMVHHTRSLYPFVLRWGSECQGLGLRIVSRPCNTLQLQLAATHCILLCLQTHTLIDTSVATHCNYNSPNSFVSIDTYNRMYLHSPCTYKHKYLNCICIQTYLSQLFLHIYTSICIPLPSL